MTVENLLNYPMAPPSQMNGHGRLVAPPHSQPMRIPRRTRHPSWGSTGSYSSGKTSPVSISPPISQYSPRARIAVDRTSSLSGVRSVNPTRYKTELCRPYEESGYCKYGEKCQFAHGGPEMRSLSRHPKYKTELCRTFHTVGFCPYGPRCHFIHNEDELRLTEINHMKHQQVLKQVAQQVAQHHQVLSQLALQQQQQQQQLLSPPKQLSSGGQLQQPTRLNLNFSRLSLTSSSLDSAASVTDSSPSLSPTSMLGDDVFTGVTTPPPGFSALPTSAPPALVSVAGVFNLRLPIFNKLAN